MLALLLLGVLVLILVLLYDGLAWLFSDVGAILICVLSVLSLVRFIAVLSSFPGSFWFMRRQLQLDFNSDYCSRLNQNSEKLAKYLQGDFENGKISSSKYRLSYTQMTKLIDSIYVFKLLMNQHIQVFKRMSECNTLSMHQNRFLRVLEDIKRTVKYKIKFEVEEITVMLEKPGHQSLYEFDKVRFIELVNKVQRQ